MLSFASQGFKISIGNLAESTFCSTGVQNSSSPSKCRESWDGCKLRWTFTACTQTPIHSTIHICIKYEVQYRKSHFYLKKSHLVLVWFLFFKYLILFKTLYKRNCIWLLSVEYVTYKLICLLFCWRRRVSKHIHQEKEERNRKVLCLCLFF